MAEVREAAGSGETRSRNWRGWYGYVDIDHIQPSCVIDNLQYSEQHVKWQAPGGGTRQAALRPLYPDDERKRVYHNFYKALTEDLAKRGQLVPVLLWSIHGKLYCRYGASRIYVMRDRLQCQSVKAIICDFDCVEWDEANFVPLTTPQKVLEVLGNPHEVGLFEVSHEKIDLHNVVP